MISQSIYTTHPIAGVTRDELIDMGSKNAMICEALGLTGRFFVIEDEHLSIIEGPTALCQKYSDAFMGDPRARSPLSHSFRAIPKLEFENYSVWVKHRWMDDPFANAVNTLTRETLDNALPNTLSTRVRLIVDGYVRERL